MLTQEKARSIAFAFITDLAQKAGRQYIILEEKIIEKPYAWVFPFTTQEYAETGNIRAMVLGTGPIVVNRQTSAVLIAPSMPIQQHLAQYEENLPTNFRYAAEKMEILGERNILRIPLAALQFAPDIRTRITQDEAAFRQHCLRLYSDYDPEVLERLRTQLWWAIQNPDYNFQGVLIDVKTANVDILFYFAFLLNVLEQVQGKPEDQFTP